MDFVNKRVDRFKENFRLKKVQNIVEFVLLVYMIYILFPTQGNIFVLILKGVVSMFILLFSMYFISLILDKLRLHIEANYHNWLRKNYEVQYSIRYNHSKNTTIKNFLLKLANIFMNKEKTYYVIMYYIRNETLISLFVLSSVIILGYMVWILFL